MGHVWDIVYNENSPEFPEVVLIIVNADDYAGESCMEAPEGQGAKRRRCGVGSPGRAASTPNVYSDVYSDVSWVDRGSSRPLLHVNRD